MGIRVITISRSVPPLFCPFVTLLLMQEESFLKDGARDRRMATLYFVRASFSALLPIAKLNNDVFGSLEFVFDVFGSLEVYNFE